LTPKLALCLPNPVARNDSMPLWTRNSCDPDTLLFVGRFDRIKGGDSVLLTYKQLLKRHPGLKLLFVGPDRGVLEQGEILNFQAYVDKHFNITERKNIVYLGELPQDQIQTLRCRSIATVVASVWETGPYTALEAMVQGCPVVAFETGGTGEIMEHGKTGLLAPLLDHSELGRQISILIDDPSYGEVLGGNARDYVSRMHDPAAQAGATVDFYDAVVENY
jgi:glycosyltransferase involved in cell wall biosynthesis